MTFVGRMLVVVILALSFLFMGFAAAVYTAQSNWMVKAKKADTELANAKRDLQSVRDEMERARTADKARFDELDNKYKTLEGEINRVQQENASVNKDNKDVKMILDTEREVARLNSDEAKERISESMLQRGKNSELFQSRNEVFAQLKAAEDKLFAMELQQQQFIEKHNQVLKELAIKNAFLASKDLPTDPKQMTATTIPPTDVEGVVLDYRKAERGKNELVEISLGSDDDLRIGHVLTVYNDDKYLGQIKLLEVTPDRSVGLVVKKAKNTTIKKGDNVSTKL